MGLGSASLRDPKEEVMHRKVLGRWAALALLAFTACGRSELVGTWTGRDEQGVQIVYVFRPDGTGYRRVGEGQQEPLAYALTSGYPNLIEVAIDAGGAAEVQQGLIERVSDVEIRLELAPAGAPAPRQLSDSAVTLRKPATR
jgi:hypothetical protein